MIASVVLVSVQNFLTNPNGLLPLQPVPLCLSLTTMVTAGAGVPPDSLAEVTTITFFSSNLFRAGRPKKCKNNPRSQIWTMSFRTQWKAFLELKTMSVRLKCNTATCLESFAYERVGNNDLARTSFCYFPNYCALWMGSAALCECTSFFGIASIWTHLHIFE